MANEEKNDKGQHSIEKKNKFVNWWCNLKNLYKGLIIGGLVATITLAIVLPITLSLNQTYLVTFDSKGGSEVASQKVKKGDKVTKPSDPTKTDYTFDNWYTTSECNGDSYNFDTLVSNNFTLYANWKAIPVQQFTVTFDTDGGSSVSSVKVDKGSKVTRPTTDPTKNGYVFYDWYTTRDFTDIFDFNKAINEDITIYAYFKEAKQAFFDVNKLASNKFQNSSTIYTNDDVSSAFYNGNPATVSAITYLGTVGNRSAQMTINGGDHGISSSGIYVYSDDPTKGIKDYLGDYESDNKIVIYEVNLKEGSSRFIIYDTDMTLMEDTTFDKNGYIINQISEYYSFKITFNGEPHNS